MFSGWARTHGSSSWDCWVCVDVRSTCVGVGVAVGVSVEYSSPALAKKKRDKSVFGGSYNLQCSVIARLLDSYTLGEVARFIDVAAEVDGKVVGKKLQWNHS